MHNSALRVLQLLQSLKAEEEWVWASGVGARGGEAFECRRRPDPPASLMKLNKFEPWFTSSDVTRRQSLLRLPREVQHYSLPRYRFIFMRARSICLSAWWRRGEFIGTTRVSLCPMAGGTLVRVLPKKFYFHACLRKSHGLARWVVRSGVCVYLEPNLKKYDLWLIVEFKLSILA